MALQYRLLPMYVRLLQTHVRTMESRRSQRLTLSPLIIYLLSVSLITKSTFRSDGPTGVEKKA